MVGLTDSSAWTLQQHGRMVYVVNSQTGHELTRFDPTDLLQISVALKLIAAATDLLTLEERMSAAFWAGHFHTLTDHTYTRAQVSTAVNKAADLVIDNVDDSESAEDTANLVVNATMTLLERPEATITEIVEENYDDEAWEQLR